MGLILDTCDSTAITQEEECRMDGYNRVDDFEKTQCDFLLKKLGSFVNCDDCRYLQTDRTPDGEVKWCRMSGGLDGDLENGAGCTRGKSRPTI